MPSDERKFVNRRANNTSGYRGVTRYGHTNRWQANVFFGGYKVFLGCFKTPEEASDAYVAYVTEHRGVTVFDGPTDERSREEENAGPSRWQLQLARDPSRAALYAEHRLKTTRLRKLEMIAAYGGACECCGETNPEFLSIDHINGDGKADRLAIGAGGTLYRKLRELGYPKDRYRLLCYNCNLALGFFGYCPHKQEGVFADLASDGEVSP